MTETRTILVVDDNPAIVRLIAEYLRGEPDLVVESAGCLAEGLARLERGGVHLVLLDLGLPDTVGSGGFSTVRARFPQAAVIVCTGVDDDELAAETIGLGALDFLPKIKMRRATLLSAVRRALDHRSS